MAWSPDGTRLATAGTDGIARIWDATTGEPFSSAHRTHHEYPVAGLVARRHPPGQRQRRRHRAPLGRHHRRDPHPAHRPHRPCDAALAWSPTAPAWLPPATTAPPASATPPPATPSPHTLGHTCEFDTISWSPTVPAWPPPALEASPASGMPPPADPHSPELTGPHQEDARQWPGLPTAPVWPPAPRTARSCVWDPTTGTGTAVRSPGHTGPVHRRRVVARRHRPARHPRAGDASVRLWIRGRRGRYHIRPHGTTVGVQPLAWSPDDDPPGGGRRRQRDHDHEPLAGTAAPTPDDDAQQSGGSPGRDVRLRCWSSSGTVPPPSRRQPASPSSPRESARVPGARRRHLAPRVDRRRAPAIGRSPGLSPPGRAPWSPDGKLIAIADRGVAAAVQRRRRSGGRRTQAQRQTESHPSVTWSPDGTMLATEDHDVVRLWRFTAGRWRGRAQWRVVQTLAGHTAPDPRPRLVARRHPPRQHRLRRHPAPLGSGIRTAAGLHRHRPSRRRALRRMVPRRPAPRHRRRHRFGDRLGSERPGGHLPRPPAFPVSRLGSTPPRRRPTRRPRDPRTPRPRRPRPLARASRHPWSHVHRLAEPQVHHHRGMIRRPHPVPRPITRQPSARDQGRTRRPAASRPARSRSARPARPSSPRAGSPGSR